MGWFKKIIAVMKQKIGVDLLFKSLFILLLALFFAISKQFYDIEIQVYYYKVNFSSTINLYDIYIASMLLYLIELIYKLWKHQQNPWLFLSVWLLVFICVSIGFFSYIYTLDDIALISDYLLNKSWFNIKYNYVIEYKKQYFKDYLNYIILLHKLTLDQKTFITNIFDKPYIDHIFINDTITIVYIKQYIEFVVEIALAYYDKRDFICFQKETWGPLMDQLTLLLRNIALISYFFKSIALIEKYKEAWYIVTHPTSPIAGMYARGIVKTFNIIIRMSRRWF